MESDGTFSSMEAVKAFVKHYTTASSSAREKLLSDLTLAAASKGEPLLG